MPKLMTMERYAALHPVPSLDDVLDDPDRWMDEARNGNGRAGVSLFRVAVAAANPHSDPGPLPSELTRRPITWLELGADHGDPEAQVLFALDAGPDRSWAQPVDSTPEERRDRRAKCLLYLEAAASAGIEEAFGILASGYQTGEFGARDSVASAAVLQALAQLNPIVSYQQHAEQHSATLSALDRERAARRAADIVARFERS